VTNIVKNATEAIEPKLNGERGRVTVAVAKTAEDIITIDVIDTGRGFPASDRQKLLEPYMTTRKEGTGLGLAIVGKILEEHGGGIELLDHPDAAEGRSGAWVRLWFPANAMRDGRDSASVAADGRATSVLPGSSRTSDETVPEEQA